MNHTRKTILRGAIFLLVLSQFSSCYVSKHYVGDGGTYDGKKMSEYDVKRKHWYLFWGALPLDDNTADKIAGDAQNYTAKESFSFGDMCIQVITFGIASPRTVRISKSEAEK